MPTQRQGAAPCRHREVHLRAWGFTLSDVGCFGGFQVDKGHDKFFDLKGKWEAGWKDIVSRQVLKQKNQLVNNPGELGILRPTLNIRHGEKQWDSRCVWMQRQQHLVSIVCGVWQKERSQGWLWSFWLTEGMKPYFLRWEAIGGRSLVSTWDKLNLRCLLVIQVEVPLGSWLFGSLQNLREKVWTREMNLGVINKCSIYS